MSEPNKEERYLPNTFKTIGRISMHYTPYIFCLLHNNNDIKYLTCFKSTK